MTERPSTFIGTSAHVTRCERLKRSKERGALWDRCNRRAGLFAIVVAILSMPAAEPASIVRERNAFCRSAGWDYASNPGEGWLCASCYWDYADEGLISVSVPDFRAQEAWPTLERFKYEKHLPASECWRISHTPLAEQVAPGE